MTAASAASVASPDFVSLADAGAKDAAALVAEARRRVRAKVVADGRISAERLEAEQHAAHGLAWLATYAEAIREMAAYAERLSAEGRFGATEDLLVRVGMGEYLDQIFSGIPMSPGARSRTVGEGRGPLPDRGRGRSDRGRQHRAEQSSPGRADPRCAGLRDARRCRP